MSSLSLFNQLNASLLNKSIFFNSHVKLLNSSVLYIALCSRIVSVGAVLGFDEDVCIGWVQHSITDEFLCDRDGFIHRHTQIWQVVQKSRETWTKKIQSFRIRHKTITHLMKSFNYQKTSQDTTYYTSTLLLNSYFKTYILLPFISQASLYLFVLKMNHFHSNISLLFVALDERGC